ncbi:map kinase [Naegleria gruberi]|uniref:mitogen-activated protein kinase kinase n=1 Tax=Naegleria gruberi TaxID=5762 RepID=D2VIZ0_NAEGR|nr:map kinase [Naegleria gruberi]EFC43108.1 map kinase [Naegleria gruberi]|eukprot:XP_002675852.1 map kinase [Naegleria gruberi]
MPQDNPFEIPATSSSDVGLTRDSTFMNQQDPSPSTTTTTTNLLLSKTPSSLKTKKVKSRQLGLSITAPSSDQYPEEDPAGMGDEIPSFLLDEQSAAIVQPGKVISTIGTLPTSSSSPIPVRLLSNLSLNDKRPSSSVSSPSSSIADNFNNIANNTTTSVQVTPLRMSRKGTSDVKKKKGPMLKLEVPVKTKLANEFTVSHSGTWKAEDILIGRGGLISEKLDSATTTPSSSENLSVSELHSANSSSSITPLSGTSEAFSPIGEVTRGSKKIAYEDLKIYKTKLGEGASGKVYRAHLKNDKTQQFALKVIDIYAENVTPKQILSEIKSLCDSVQCDNIVKFYEAYHREGSIRILMEYMNCGALDDIYRTTGSIPEDVLSEISFQILKALAYLAEKGVIHRDIKPANVLLNKNGVTKLTDFGMSNQNLKSKDFKTFQGTFYYMSPERLKGLTHSVDSDIWSVGVLIAECAIGGLPFTKGAEVSVWTLLKHVQSNPEVVTIKPGEVSDEFFDFIHKCMEEEPINRPSAKQLLNHPYIKKYIKDQDNFKPVRTAKWLKEVYLPKKKEKEEQKNLDFNTLSDIVTNSFQLKQ